MSARVRHVLLPGRHHLVTRFQTAYLHSLLAGDLADSSGRPVECAADADVVWAVTSATHSGTRRNPVPAHRREAMIERVAAVEGLPSLVAPVADVPPSPRFARTVLASVELSTGVTATPLDTVVACSTPEVAAMYAELGFRVVPVEDACEDAPARPWDVLELLAAGDERWRDLAHPEVVRFYDRYRLDAQIALIHADPTVSTEGDLTTTRDYRSYTAAFDDASDRKWDQVARFVEPGRVVDLGCAAGGLLERAARDPRLAESDLYGVDVSRHLVAEAEHRRAQGVFANPNVFFAQRNLLRSAVFPVASVSTTLTVALTHEIASYGEGRSDLELLAKRIYEHTAPGGVWVCSDVLGPADGDRLVHLVLDGTGAGVAPVDLDGWTTEAVARHVAALSPAERLVQLAQDFPALSGGECDVRWVADGVAELTLRAAMEFLYTRDYVDSWLSECHERFCDMTWPDWVALLEGVGFAVEPGSGAWRNEWLVENRLSVGAALRDAATGAPVPWPETHVTFVARRPL
ncbi:class I SAM-dependent methyltransferase [Cellulomonas shaoxiangyii]|uniref:Methyltransferase domain-containing protein n=1 Tax=Cellulomonas shaoxiangyii TaxID=2566013 RepID=A0A4P7SHC8_9CELL|nr:class I SAM-dependent methyltransferase [Cellulomonas shaoxiangyii]QCB93370.1 methyltransferase domain-containing protein [Cellulomonas shaoxiangyii]TGY85332.1 methyltransferase domain-containing protein [Cellulomonas shaoxiangyii]